MRTVLVTGSPEAATPVLEAVRSMGAEAIGLTEASGLVTALGELEAGSVSCYVQLPVGIAPEGESAVSRVHSFLEQGLLTRFRLADAVRPALTDDATVVLVGGHTLVEQQAPDDQGARLALLTVLAYAVRADRAVMTRVRVLDHLPAQEIADIALTGRGPSQEATARSAEAIRAYEDGGPSSSGLAGPRSGRRTTFAGAARALRSLDRVCEAGVQAVGRGADRDHQAAVAGCGTAGVGDAVTLGRPAGSGRRRPAGHRAVGGRRARS
jgi:hypothetical protein